VLTRSYTRIIFSFFSSACACPGASLLCGGFGTLVTSAWYGIRRRRVFLCSYLDTDVPVAIPVPSDDGWGPLLYQNLQPIPLAPLLRSRGFIHDCVLKLSWTGYQPHAVMWDYSHFGGKAASAAHCQMLEGSKTPNLPWAGIIPAHFLGTWREFLQTIKADQSKQNRRDELIDQLVPLFHNPNIRLPIRILTVREARSLAGLTDILPSDKHNPVVMTVTASRAHAHVGLACARACWSRTRTRTNGALIFSRAGQRK